MTVSRPEYGEAWPLTVDSGLLACNDDAVTFAVNGKTYGLNGFALQQGFPRPNPIWANNPDVPGTKKDIGVLIDRGLELCEG